MSERFTSATAPGCSGIADYGRKSHAEMVTQFRRHYASQLAEAQRALSLADDEIQVHTYIGAIVERRKERVMPEGW